MEYFARGRVRLFMRVPYLRQWYYTGGSHSDSFLFGRCLEVWKIEAISCKDEWLCAVEMLCEDS